MATDVGEIYLRVHRKDIAFIQAIFDSYEGVGVMRTVERCASRDGRESDAVIVVLTVADFLEHALDILVSLQPHVEWEEVTPSPHVNNDWLMRELRKPR